jgi:acetyl-CoA acetyltransferase
MKMADRMELLRVRLRTRLAYLGVPRSALAEQMGLTSSGLALRLAARDIKLGHAEDLAVALGVSPAYLLDPAPERWNEQRADPPAWAQEFKAKRATAKQSLTPTESRDLS